jgi:dCTP deaminase
MLSNVEIQELLAAHPTLIEGASEAKPNRTATLIQPASIDLTVGEILVPPAREDQLDFVHVVRDNHLLKHGATILIKTRERLNLPDEIGGLMFPKNGRFALKGLMITNFGHVDPGYSGHLKYTVINFGSDEFRISVGDRITCLTLYRLERPANPSWPALQQNDAETMESHAKVLSRDFLDIENRIAGMIRTEVHSAIVRREKLRDFFLPLTLALLGIIITITLFMVSFFWPLYQEMSDRIGKIETRRSIIERIFDQ